MHDDVEGSYDFALRAFQTNNLRLFYFTNSVFYSSFKVKKKQQHFSHKDSNKAENTRIIYIIVIFVTNISYQYR